MNKLIIVGASGHGKVLADIALLNGYHEIFFLDDNEKITSVGEFDVLGKFEKIFSLSKKDYDVVIGIGNTAIRRKMQTQLEQQNYNIVTLIHPAAVIAHDVSVGVGTVIMAGAVINSGTVIGKGCIINTLASVDHDNRVGDFVHVSVASHTSGSVKLGDNTWVGIGAVISNNLNISSDVTIGAGAVVVSGIHTQGVYIGVPAKRMRNKANV